MTSDRINLGRRKQEGTPECQINLRNRKAVNRARLEQVKRSHKSQRPVLRDMKSAMTAALRGSHAPAE